MTATAKPPQHRGKTEPPDGPSEKGKAGDHADNSGGPGVSRLLACSLKLTHRRAPRRNESGAGTDPSRRDPDRTPAVKRTRRSRGGLRKVVEDPELERRAVPLRC
jgi:hypothetical protein